MHRLLFRRSAFTRTQSDRQGIYRAIDISCSEVEPPRCRSATVGESIEEDLYKEMDPVLLKRCKILVSSPHRLSHIRFIRFDPDERVSGMERIYRNHLEEIQRFHHDFWEENNKIFDNYLSNLEYSAKFVESRSPSHEEISEVYRNYLENSHERHAKYTSLWMKKNFKLLPIAVVAGIAMIMRRTSKLLDSAATALTRRFPYVRQHTGKETLKQD